jgi:hypothetical protein
MTNETPSTQPPTYDGTSAWQCTECGHTHTGIQLNWICIGCPCEYVPDHPMVKA